MLMTDFSQRCLLLLLDEVYTPVVPTSINAQIDQMIWTDHYNDLSLLRWRRRWLGDGIVLVVGVDPAAEMLNLAK